MLSVASQSFSESSYFRLQPLQIGKNAIQNLKKILRCRGFEVRAIADISLMANFETKTTPELISS